MHRWVAVAAVVVLCLSVAVGAAIFEERVPLSDAIYRPVEGSHPIVRWLTRDGAWTPSIR